MVDRQFEAQPPLLRPTLHIARRVQELGLDQRLADRHAPCLQERVGHRAADQQRVQPGNQVLDHLELVGDLRSAKHRHERTVGCLEHAPEILDLLAHQQSRGRLSHVVHDAFRGGMRPVRRSKRVVHIHVRQRGQLLREAGVVLLFLRMEPQIL